MCHNINKDTRNYYSTTSNLFIMLQSGTQLGCNLKTNRPVFKSGFSLIIYPYIANKNKSYKIIDDAATNSSIRIQSINREKTT